MLHSWLYFKGTVELYLPQAQIYWSLFLSILSRNDSSLIVSDQKEEIGAKRSNYFSHLSSPSEREREIEQMFGDVRSTFFLSLCASLDRLSSVSSELRMRWLVNIWPPLSSFFFFPFFADLSA